MGRVPRDYSGLRTEHARAIEADGVQPVQQSTDRLEEPTRPAINQAQSPGWTEYGDMAAQQTSAIAYNNWLNQNYATRAQLADRANERIDELRTGLDQVDERTPIDPRLQRAQELAAAVAARSPSTQREIITQDIGQQQQVATGDQESEAPSKNEQNAALEQTDARVQRAIQLAVLVGARQENQQNDRSKEQDLDIDD